MRNSKLQIDFVHEDCVRWLEESGDQGKAVGGIGKTKRESIEALLEDSVNRIDNEEFVFYTVELAAFVWFNECAKGKEKKPRTKRHPQFRFRRKGALQHFYTYLRKIEALSQQGKELPKWAHQALLEGWKPPPNWQV